jgi:uncharacterized protein YraI
MNRRILVLAIALLSAALLVTDYGHAVGYAAPVSPVLKVEGKVIAYGLNVRTGPGMAYPIIGGLSRGDTVEVVRKNTAGTWLRIAYSGQGELNGQEAWIAAAYVDLSGSLVTVPVVSAPPLPTAAMASPTPTQVDRQAGLPGVQRLRHLRH